MLIAFPVLPLLASTMVSPGRSSPSRSARSIMYLAIRALIDPDGLRCSSLTHIPSTMISGVPPIASRIVPPPRPVMPAAGRAAPVAGSAAPFRASRAAERVLLVAFMLVPPSMCCRGGLRLSGAKPRPIGRIQYLPPACSRVWSQVVGQGLGDVPLVPELCFAPRLAWPRIPGRAARSGATDPGLALWCLLFHRPVRRRVAGAGDGRYLHRCTPPGKPGVLVFLPS